MGVDGQSIASLTIVPELFDKTRRRGIRVDLIRAAQEQPRPWLTGCPIFETTRVALDGVQHSGTSTHDTEGSQYRACPRHDAGMSSGTQDERRRSLHSPADYLALAREPNLAEDRQRMLIAKDLSFVDEALAGNPSTSERSLIEILSKTRATDWSCNRILKLIAGHRSASPGVLLLVRDGIVRQLHSGARPYAAGVVLAERPEIPIAEVAVLTTVPGGSKRFRRALRDTMQCRHERENGLETGRG